MILIRVSPEAEVASERIDSWWRLNRPKAASAFSAELGAALKLLQQFPEAGPPYRRRGVKGIRRLFLTASRHHVYYEYDAHSRTVTVLTIWFAMRRRGPSLVNR